MCTVLLPPGVNPVAVNKYIKIDINNMEMVSFTPCPFQQQRGEPFSLGTHLKEVGLAPEPGGRFGDELSFPYGIRTPDRVARS